MTAVLVRTGVAACCGGHRPAAGGCCWKCPTCRPAVLARLDLLVAATAAALAVLPVDEQLSSWFRPWPPVQGVLT